jgi:hypothetical protein
MSASASNVKWVKSDLENAASATVHLIRTYLPHFQLKIESDPKHGWWDLRLPAPDGADYSFSLNGELGGERQISATPLTKTGVHPRRFWYSAMEMADFRNDASKLESLFHERLKGLLQHPTRIVESKGIILLGYKAEYEGERGWQSLGGVSYLGLGFGIPLVGKKRVYTSPPVASYEQQ